MCIGMRAHRTRAERVGGAERRRQHRGRLADCRRTGQTRNHIVNQRLRITLVALAGAVAVRRTEGGVSKNLVENAISTLFLADT